MQAEEKMPDWTIEGIINIMFFGKAKGNYAEAMQSGGLGLCAVRFCSLEDISTIGVVSDSGHRLPVQAELDKRIAAAEAAK